MNSIFLIQNNKDPKSVLSKMSGSKTILLDFFYFENGKQHNSKTRQRNQTNHGTVIMYVTILSVGLWLSSSVLTKIK